MCQSAISITSVTSSCSCTNLDMKLKAEEEGVKKAQLTVLPLGKVEQFRLASEEMVDTVPAWRPCRLSWSVVGSRWLERKRETNLQFGL